MRNLVALPVLMLLAGLLETGQAMAAGAVAIGVAPRGVRQGYASGYRVNAPDVEAAKASALAQCKKVQPNVSGTASNSGSRAAQANCEIVTTFTGKCYAQAVDPKDGTPGVGWSVANTQQEADDEAMARCKSTAGADRRAYCKVFDRACDRGE